VNQLLCTEYYIEDQVLNIDLVTRKHASPLFIDAGPSPESVFSEDNT